MSNNRDSSQSIDQGAIANLAFNQAAGVYKVAQAGLKLKPLKLSDISHTTDFSTLRLVGKGATLAFYNSTGAALTVTMGGSAQTSLAAGATSADGKVGIPVPANSWFYANSYDDTHAITSAAGLLGFIVEDATSISTRP
jgi:hypothetical protein